MPLLFTHWGLSADIDYAIDITPLRHFHYLAIDYSFRPPMAIIRQIRCRHYDDINIIDIDISSATHPHHPPRPLQQVVFRGIIGGGGEFSYSHTVNNTARYAIITAFIDWWFRLISATLADITYASFHYAIDTAIADWCISALLHWRGANSALLFCRHYIFIDIFLISLRFIIAISYFRHYWFFSLITPLIDAITPFSLPIDIDRYIDTRHYCRLALHNR